MSDARTGSTGITFVDTVNNIKRAVEGSLDAFKEAGGDPNDVIDFSDDRPGSTQAQQPGAPQSQQEVEQGPAWYASPEQAEQKAEKAKPRPIPKESQPGESGLSRMERANRRRARIQKEREDKAKKEYEKRVSWNDQDVADRLGNVVQKETMRQWLESQPLALPPTEEEVVEKGFRNASLEEQDRYRAMQLDPESFKKRKKKEEEEKNELSQKEIEESKKREAERSARIKRAQEAQDAEIERITGKKPERSKEEKEEEKKEEAKESKPSTKPRSSQDVAKSNPEVAKAVRAFRAARRKLYKANEKAAKASDKDDIEKIAEEILAAQADVNKTQSAMRKVVEKTVEKEKKRAKGEKEKKKKGKTNNDKGKKKKQKNGDVEEGELIVSDPNGNAYGPKESEFEDVWEILPNIPNSGAQGRNLLPGGFDPKFFTVSESLLKKEKMSDDKKIEKAMKYQSKQLLSFFKNRVSVRKGKDEEKKKDDYSKDWDEGKREYGRYDTDLSDKERAVLKAIEKQLDWIGFCYVPTEGQWIDKKGNIRQSDDVENAINSYMNHMGFAPHEKWLVFHQVAKRLGYSPDSDGKFLLQDSNKIPDELFMQALRDLERATVIHKNPYHMFGRAPKYGGTKCFPVGIMTKEEAEILCRQTGPLNGISELDAMSNARNDFFNYTLPEIRRVAHVNGNTSQLMVVYNYVRALCSLDDMSPRLFGVPDALDRGYDELCRQCDPTLNPDADPEVNKERMDRIVRAEKRRNKRRYKLDRQRNRTRSVYQDDVVDPVTGEIIHAKGERINPETYVRGNVRMELRSSKVHPFEAACMFSANMAKFMGVIGFTPVIVSGYVEHFSGNINASISNRIIASLMADYGESGNAYRVNKTMYDLISTDEAIDAIKAWKSLLRVGGQDAVALFREEYDVLNTENARKFLNDCVNKTGLFNGEKARIVKNIAARVSEGLEILLPGDIGFGKKDARRWLEGFMINNQMNANKGDIDERSFNSHEVLEMMQSMGMGGFLAAATDTQAGRDAAVMMRNSTLARESPLTHMVDTILKRSGLANVIITLGVDTYFTYGLNLVQAMLPLSNTVSYLAVRGVNKVLTGGVKNLDKDNISILEYQMGGLDSFGQGLVKNLLYDFVRIGNVGIFACITAAILIMIGYDEPEDIALKYRWDEYIIGKKIGLGGFDDNGNPLGIPVYRAWWLDDLTLFGLPLAYAIASCNIDQKLGENDPDLPMKQFCDGCYDVLSGASMFDLVRSIKNVDRILMEYDELMTNPDKAPDEDWFSYAYMQFFELPVARGLNKMLVPNFMRDMMRDEYEHTPYKEYNRDSKTPGATETVKDWVDLQRRIESRYNPVYALWNNITINKYPFDDGSTQKTGYFYNEMPLAFEPDARKTSFLETKLDYVPLTEVNPDEKEEYVEQKCEQLVDMIKNDYDWNVDKAIADGFTIPLDLRFEFASYVNRRWNFAVNVYNEAVQNGVRGAEKNDMWTKKENDILVYKTLLNDWIWNTEQIPWTDEGYVKLRTDYSTIYYRKSTGEPVPETQYLIEGPGDIEKRYFPKGNIPNNFALFTTPETQGRGFNYETKVSWFDKNLTDVDKIFKEQSGVNPNLSAEEQPGKVTKYGYNKGVPLNTAMFAGNPNFPTNKLMESDTYEALNDPTTGRRALAPFKESMLWDLPNFNGKYDEEGKLVNENIPENSAQKLLKQITRENVDPGNLGEMGKYYDPDHWKTTTTNPYGNGYGSRGGYGRRSYSRRSGGGGSSYNPKIYNTRSYSTHVSNTHVGSTHTGTTSRSISPDRAATMYSKQLQDTRVNTYLRPGFSTKGSREAYKRQDI